MKSNKDPSTRVVDVSERSPQIVAAQILDGLRQHLPAILERYPVALAYAYGSVTEGHFTPLSDVDIALVLAQNSELGDYQRFVMELSIAAEVERQAGVRNADVRSITDAPLRVQGKVVTQGKLLYSSDEDFRVVYEVRIRHRYFDLQPALAEMREAYFTRLSSDSGERRHSMVQPDKIEGVFRNLDTFVEQLRQLAQVPQEELKDDLVKLGAAKYYLQVAIECCLDAANHVIAQQEFRPPESYADSFTVLAENGIIDEDFAATCRQMAKMRNRLVHLYWEVDANIIYDVLQNNLDDFDRFKRDVYAYMRGLEQDPGEVGELG